MIDKLGLQLYTVYKHLNDEDEIRKTFKSLKELGYDEAETCGCEIDYGLFYDLAEEAGIKIIGAQAQYDLMKSDIESVIRENKKLHVKDVGVGGFDTRSEEEVKGFIEYANKIAKRFGEEGLKFTYHNHNHEFIRFPNGKCTMDMLLEEFDPENTSFVLDTCWVQHAGCDVCSWIEKMSGRIDIVHLKDLTMERDWTNWGIPKAKVAAVGKGNMDFKRIIEACEKAGVKHYCIELDNCPEDYHDELKFISDYMHKNFIK